MKRGFIGFAVVAIFVLIAAIAWAATHGDILFAQGGLQVGPSGSDPGSKLTRKYACLLKVDPPSLATTCTVDKFTLNGPQGDTNFAFKYMPDGTLCTAVAAIKKGDNCVVTMGTNATEAYTQSCRIPATGEIDVKSCTNGTVDGATQNVLITVDSFQP